MLQENQFAPEFTARDENGGEVKLTDFRGQKVVLYFYPKDDTPGCTKQACSLRDGFADLQKANIKVLGVSLDDEKSHQKFIEKYDLPFTLLADTDRRISESYGVYGEKKMYGKTFMGINRTTFLIDEEGRIKRILPKVNVENHAQEILEAFGV